MKWISINYEYYDIVHSTDEKYTQRDRDIQKTQYQYQYYILYIVPVPYGIDPEIVAAFTRYYIVITHFNMQINCALWSCWQRCQHTERTTYATLDTPHARSIARALMNHDSCANIIGEQYMVFRSTITTTLQSQCRTGKWERRSSTLEWYICESDWFFFGDKRYGFNTPRLLEDK